MNGTMEIVRRLSEDELPTLPDPRIVDHQEAGEAYRALNVVEQGAVFGKGYIAACIQEQGGIALREFADREDVEDSYSALQDHATVYRRFKKLDESSEEDLLIHIKSGQLKYTHLRIATPLHEDEEYVEVLQDAADDRAKGKSGRLAEEVRWRVQRQVSLAAVNGDYEHNGTEDQEDQQAALDAAAEDSDHRDETPADPPELPPKELSEEQRAAFDMPRILLALRDYDPRVVAGVHDTPADVRREIDQVRQVRSWLDSYQRELAATLRLEAVE